MLDSLKAGISSLQASCCIDLYLDSLFHILFIYEKSLLFLKKERKNYRLYVTMWFILSSLSFSSSPMSFLPFY